MGIIGKTDTFTTIRILRAALDDDASLTGLVSRLGERGCVSAPRQSPMQIRGADATPLAEAAAQFSQADGILLGYD